MGQVIHDPRLGPRPKPIPCVDLAEYREQVDRGSRAVPSMLFDGLGADPPRLRPEEANYIGGELEDIRATAMSAAKAADGKQPVELHQRLMALAAEVEDLSVRLAEWSAGSPA